MKKKFIEFALNDGSIYRVPLEAIAHNRAKDYAKSDRDTTYQEEFDFVMSDDYEGIDWLGNNMNPDEYVPFVKQFKAADPVDMEVLLDEAPKSIVEAEVENEDYLKPIFEE